MRRQQWATHTRFRGVARGVEKGSARYDAKLRSAGNATATSTRAQSAMIRGSRVARAVVRKPLAVPNSLKNADGSSRIAERKMERELERIGLNGMDWKHDGTKGFFEHQPGFLLARPRC
jgi:hypothetical protein